MLAKYKKGVGVETGDLAHTDQLPLGDWFCCRSDDRSVCKVEDLFF